MIKVRKCIFVEYESAGLVELIGVSRLKTQIEIGQMMGYNYNRVCLIYPQKRVQNTRMTDPWHFSYS